MPVYNYECQCGNKIEQLSKMDQKTTKCPKCAKSAKKVMSLSTFEIRGAGVDVQGIRK